MVETLKWEELLAAQELVLTPAKLTAQHISRTAVHRKIRAGDWRPIFGGAVWTSADAPTFEAKLWAISELSAPQAVISHSAAARLHNLDGSQDLPWLIELTVPRGNGRATNDELRVHHTRRFDFHDVRKIWGIQCTSLPRTIVDLFESIDDRPTLVKLFEDASRRGRASRKALKECVDRLRPGLKRVHLLDELMSRRPWDSTPTECAAEALADDALWRAGIFLQRQVNFHDDDGFIGRVDFYYPQLRWALEVDGRQKYELTASHVADRRRDQRLKALGVEPTRVSYQDVENESAFLSQMRTILERRKKDLGLDRTTPMPKHQLKFAF